MMPELEPGALGLADTAFLETSGSTAAKVKAAVQAYLWAVGNTREIFDGLTVYPSHDELREAMRS